jgi:Transglycosylase-like domain
MERARSPTVSRLLTKRRHFTPILFILLALPAAALAAGDEEKAAGPAIGPAEAAPLAPLQRPVNRFHRVMRTIAADIRADERAAAKRKEREAEERFAELGVSMATLESIASCESGGDPAAVSSDGSYRGKYQFDYGTWESMGGSGDPAAAPEAEQDYRAALLYAQSGASPWPVCGQ